MSNKKNIRVGNLYFAIECEKVYLVLEHRVHTYKAGGTEIKDDSSYKICWIEEDEQRFRHGSYISNDLLLSWVE
jgi:hypothetical protein